MRWTLVVTVSTLALGCKDPAAPGEGGGLLRVQPLAPTYAAGAAARHRLTNLTPASLQFTACFAQLEEQSADRDWVLVYQDADPCPAVLEYLKPWASREVAVALPEDLQPGTHRVRFPSIGVGREGAFVTAQQIGDNFEIR